MSGGVDSSVAAALLIKRGFDVIGVTMQIWQESQTDPRHAGCCSLGAVEDARRVARELGIPHYVINLKEEFKQTVIENFIDEYTKGRTPNPCVQCNRHVKFEALLEKAREFGCEKLATGHYARLRTDSKTKIKRLLQARSKEKDQSYVLYMLGQEQLNQVMFPMGELKSKAYARQLAQEFNLCVANKVDSQEICFVNEAGGYREFLRKSRPESFESGDVVDDSGVILGSHEGIIDFTIGQRRGLKVATGTPLYVLRLEPGSNKVVVGPKESTKDRVVAVDSWFWPSDQPSNYLKVQAKIRYNMVARPAKLFAGDEPRLEFDEPVQAATPGQIAVAYVGKSIISGGIISNLKRTSAISASNLKS